MPIIGTAPGIVPTLPAAGVAAATATSLLAPAAIALVPVNNTTTNFAVGSALYLPVPGSGRLEGKTWNAVLTGFVSVVATTTVKIDWYGITSVTGFPSTLGTGTGGQLAVGTYTKLTSATASASLTGAAMPTPDVYSFRSVLSCYGDSASGTLCGLLTTSYNGIAPVDSSVAITKLTGMTFGPAVTSTPTTVNDPCAWLLPAFTTTTTSGNTALYYQIDALYLFAD